MPFLSQKPSSLLLLLAMAAVAGLLSVAMLRTGAWGDGDASSPVSGKDKSNGPRGQASGSGRATQGGGVAVGNSAATGGNSADSLLPRGVQDIDGQGGTGVHRAVLKNGVWIPVFSLGTALVGGGAPADASVTEMPLSITSGSPSPGTTGVPFVFNFDAIGGSPPYRWQFAIAPAGGSFVMDPGTGLLSGVSESAMESVMEVFVTDAAGARDSARYPLVILEQMPLAIATASLPAASANQSYLAKLAATGGTAPYFWTVTGLESTGLALTPNTGEISGTPPATGDYPLQVTVTDRAQAYETRSLTLTVGNGTEDEEEKEETDLQVTTASLPEGTVDVTYSAQLAGKGGKASYQWSITPALPADLVLDVSTGLISGTPKGAGQSNFQIALTDADGAQATRTLALRIANGLDITTAMTLLPAAPGQPYQITFTASGGQAPYRWRVTQGALPPGASWALSPEGVLAGIAGPSEGLARFSVEVQDAAGLTFVKDFELAVRQALIAIASREKVGLAWRPDHIDAAMRASGSALASVAVVRGVAAFPQTPAAGTVIYAGIGSNVVDRNLPTGSRVLYTLFVQTVDGRVLPYSTAAATILPMVLGRGQAGVTGDPYADRVPLFQPLRSGGYGAASVPANITGPPDGKNTLVPASLSTEVASLHAKTGAGGGVVLEFTDNIVDLGPGADFSVFENVFFAGGNANDRFMEPAVVWVALFEDQWFRFPIDVVPPAEGQPLKLNDPFYYNRGFAGRNPTTGSDPTNPTASGGDAFDANQLGIPGLTWIRYVKLQSTGDNAWVDDFGGDPVRHPPGPQNSALSGGGTSGFDLDAVSAANY